MNAIAKGTFEVSLQPQGASEIASGAAIGRMAIDKTFSGDLEGTSKGEMLSAMGNVEGSAGYVAIERVTGKIGDRAGSFALQHAGIMDQGSPTLTVVVIPDSGTGDLSGVEGTLSIDIVDGQHFYTFRYSLPQ